MPNRRVITSANYEKIGKIYVLSWNDLSVITFFDHNIGVRGSYLKLSH